MHLNKSFCLILVLSLFTLGCNSTSATKTPDELLDDVDTPTPTLQIGTPQPLCTINSSYQVGLNDLNKPISECNLYFHVVFPIADPDERYFQVIIQPDKPFTFYDNGIVDFSNINQITPYWYRWVIKNQQGQVERAWLAYFMRGRDGLYHTIVSQSEQDWQNSYLEIFFEDVNKDGVREDVTYEIIVGEFLSKVTNP